MTISMNPLVLTPYAPVPLKSSSPSNPFVTPVPYKVPSKYWTSPEAQDKQQYALYTLVALGPNGKNDLLSAINLDSDGGSWTSTIVLPLNHDFNNKTLRDIYDHHTSLLDKGTHDVAPGKLLVAAHKDWKNNGVLLVEFNCIASNSGRMWTLGITRVPTDMAASCIMLLETDTDSFEELKAEEWEMKWPDPIEGYTDSDWGLLGHGQRGS